MDTNQTIMLTGRSVGNIINRIDKFGRRAITIEGGPRPASNQQLDSCQIDRDGDLLLIFRQGLTYRIPCGATVAFDGGSHIRFARPDGTLYTLRRTGEFGTPETKESA